MHVLRCSMTLSLPLGAVFIAEGFQTWVVVVSCGVDVVGDVGGTQIRWPAAR